LLCSPVYFCEATQYAEEREASFCQLRDDPVE
jgi:hypothetical protein